MTGSPDTPQTPSLETAGSERAVNGFRLAIGGIPDDRDRCVQILHEALGWTVIDARQRLRHVPNVWPDLLDEQSATRVSERLQTVGAETVVVQANIVPDLRLAKTLHHIRSVDAGLVIIDASGEVEATIPWSDLAALSVASVGGLNEKADNPLPNGVFHHAGGIARYDDVPQRYGLELWLIANGPPRALRIEAAEMNYEYLSDRLSASSDENFASLIEDLRHHVPEIPVSSTTKSYVVHDSPLKFRLQSSQVHGELVLATWALANAT